MATAYRVGSTASRPSVPVQPGDGPSGSGGDAGGWANGGFVTADRLAGPDPAGPDDGYGGLDAGEFVVRAPQALRFAGLLQAINDGTYDPRAPDNRPTIGPASWGSRGDDLSALLPHPPSVMTPDQVQASMEQLGPPQRLRVANALSDGVTAVALAKLLGPAVMDAVAAGVARGPIRRSMGPTAAGR